MFSKSFTGTAALIQAALLFNKIVRNTLTKANDISLFEFSSI